jgi:hypothetical protein
VLTNFILSLISYFKNEEKTKTTELLAERGFLSSSKDELPEERCLVFKNI